MLQGSETKVKESIDWPTAYVIHAPDGQAFFFTQVGDRYLSLSGSGDLVLLGEIAHTV